MSGASVSETFCRFGPHQDFWHTGALVGRKGGVVVGVTSGAEINNHRLVRTIWSCHKTSCTHGTKEDLQLARAIKYTTSYTRHTHCTAAAAVAAAAALLAASERCSLQTTNALQLYYRMTQRNCCLLKIINQQYLKRWTPLKNRKIKHIKKVYLIKNHQKGCCLLQTILWIIRYVLVLLWWD